MPLIITVMFCCAVRTAHLTFNMFPDTKGIQVIWFHKFWKHFLWDLQNCPALIQQFYWSLYPSQNEDAFSVTLREHEPWVGTREADIYSWGKGLSVNLNKCFVQLLERRIMLTKRCCICSSDLLKWKISCVTTCCSEWRCCVCEGHNERLCWNIWPAATAVVTQGELDLLF